MKQKLISKINNKPKRSDIHISQLLLIALLIILGFAPHTVAKANSAILLGRSQQSSDDVQSRAPSAVCGTTANDLGGNIFRDYDIDGVNDANEPPFYDGNIVVYAYGDDNTVVATTTVQSDGTYNFDDIFSSNDNIRLEFTGWPDYLDVGASGTGNGTDTQIHQASTCDADLAVHDSTDFCQANPLVATTCFLGGPSDGPNSADPALVSLPYDATGHDFNVNTPTSDFQVTYEAAINEIGATYGIAWQPTNELLYVGAYQKRYTGFGPDGPDAIYIVNPTTNTAVDTIELDTLLGGTDTAGVDVHNFTPDGDGVTDLASADQVGVMAWGDLEISADNTTLYAVNLFDRKIYAIDVSAGTAAGASILQSWDTPDACGAAVEHRPFGLELHNGKLWIGSVCEDISNAYVHSFTPDTAVALPTMTLEVTVPLTYTREFLDSVHPNGASALNSPGDWIAWEAFATLPIFGLQEISAPQPMLSDIEFDGESMILGLRDRFGDQSGSEEHHRADLPRNPSWGQSGGDILRVCNVSGAFVVEGGAGCVPNGYNATAGPGGAEYYHWDFYGYIDAPTPTFWDPDPNVANSSYHHETSQGSLVQLVGTDTVMMTAMDPVDDYSGGIVRFVNDTGRREGVIGADDCIDTSGGIAGCDTQIMGGYTIYEAGDFGDGSGGSSSTPPGGETFGKANGLGDLEALCNLPPLEIGRYIWLDADGDGIQDPGEAPISGVTVLLYTDPDGIPGNGDETLADTTTTDTNGLYSFVVDPNTTYYVSVDPAQAPLVNLEVTVQDYASDAAHPTSSNSTNVHDSDGVLNSDTNTVIVPVTTGVAGGNDYTFDIGFTVTAPTAVSGASGDANASSSSTLLLVIVGALTVLFITGAGLYVRARKH